MPLFSRTIWGFDLSEMRWNAFKGKNMYDKRWHLRRERLSPFFSLSEITN